VNWWSVHEFAVPRLQRAGDWPLVGSPLWVELGDRDLAKWAALLDAAQHWALRVETCQQAECVASRDLSAAEDWLAVARIAKHRGEFYSARPWLRRVAAK
jgi:hypothetical protein